MLVLVVTKPCNQELSALPSCSSSAVQTASPDPSKLELHSVALFQLLFFCMCFRSSWRHYHKGEVLCSRLTEEWEHPLSLSSKPKLDLATFQVCSGCPEATGMPSVPWLCQLLLPVLFSTGFSRLWPTWPTYSIGSRHLLLINRSLLWSLAVSLCLVNDAESVQMLIACCVSWWYYKEQSI